MGASAGQQHGAAATNPCRTLGPSPARCPGGDPDSGSARRSAVAGPPTASQRSPPAAEPELDQFDLKQVFLEGQVYGWVLGLPLQLGRDQVFRDVMPVAYVDD